MPPARLSAIRGVLFDKDGTLISFEKTWGPALIQVIGDYAKGDAGLAADLAEISMIDLATGAFANQSVVIAGTVADFAEAWAARLGVVAGPAFYAEVDQALRIAARGSLSPIGVPRRVLATLKAGGLACGIATNDAEANAREQGDSLGLSPYLDMIVGYDSGHGAKPEAGQITAFAAHVGISAGQVAMIGDSPHDMVAAKAAGAVAVAVRSGPMHVDAAGMADHVVDTIDDLPALFTT